jgi:hypothetical protein
MKKKEIKNERGTFTFPEGCVVQYHDGRKEFG